MFLLRNNRAACWLGPQDRFWHDCYRCWPCAVCTVSTKSYKCGVSSTSRLDSFDIDFGIEDTLTFWPWPRNGAFCWGGCRRWRPVRLYQVEQHCVWKLKFCQYLIFLYGARVCEWEAFLCVERLQLLCNQWTFRRVLNSWTFLIFSYTQHRLLHDR